MQDGRKAAPHYVGECLYCRPSQPRVGPMCEGRYSISSEEYHVSVGYSI